jgi:hypothetical protein
MMNTANPIFALTQLSHQLFNESVDKRMTVEKNNDLRKTKADQWKQTFSGMISGALSVGSRKPTNAPVWVTLKVLSGGFASGEYMASLQPEDIPNSEFLNIEGASRLGEMLDTGLYRIEVPENGALLVVIWLLRRGCVTEAESIINEISPWFDTLRFYPKQAETPLDVTPVISVQCAGDACKMMKDNLANCSNPSIPRIRNVMSSERSASNWIPLKKDLLCLFSKTLECEHSPMYKVSPENGKVMFEQILVDGKTILKRVNIIHEECSKNDGSQGCGWPFQQYPEGWLQEATMLYNRYEDIVCKEDLELAEWKKIYSVEHLNKSVRNKGTVADMIKILKVCVKQGTKELSGRQVGLIRSILSGSNTKRGNPSSETFNISFYRLEVTNNSCYIKEMIDRLSKYDQSCGLELETINNLMVDCEYGQMPASMRSKIDRLRIGTVSDLLESGIITSSEVIGHLIPSLVAQTTTMCIDDITLRRLYYALKIAFSKRRSLLLLNLQSQVVISELPWMKQLISHCNVVATTDAHKKASRDTLELVVCETLSHFPQTIIPNILIKSLKELAVASGLSIHFVNEIAADIFEGRFVQKYVSAVRKASVVLKGTLYERYYNLNFPTEEDVFGVDDLINKCISLSGCESSNRWRPISDNGRILEQEQILTSHNLAGLYDALGLSDKLNGYKLARKTWMWILKSLNNIPEDYKSMLQMYKNIAYAWRQLIFYISTARGDYNIIAELSWDLAKSMKKDHNRYMKFYLHFLQPLDNCLNGKISDTQVLGWVNGTHPLM